MNVITPIKFVICVKNFVLSVSQAGAFISQAAKMDLRVFAIKRHRPLVLRCLVRRTILMENDRKEHEK